MFKAVASIGLILALAAQTFKDGLIVLDYYANTVSFAKICINKAKPKLHCNGKCQMMKKLQEEERKDHGAPQRKIENEETVCLKSVFITDTSVPVKYVSKSKALYHSTWNCLSYSIEIFHPPKLS